MASALRNICGNTSARKILGTPWNGILAEQIIAETETGDNGHGALFNEAEQPAYAGKRLSMYVTSKPVVGTLRVEENGRIYADGFPDGIHVVPYDFLVESVYDSSSSFELRFGNVDAVVSGGTGTGTGSGSGGDATGQISAVVSGGTGTGVGSGSGGDAVGASGGDSVVDGGTGTGTGSGYGGDAVGQISAVVAGGTGTGTGSGSGGDASGDIGGSATVAGGTGTGIGSGSGGDASGQISAEVDGGTGTGTGSGSGGDVGDPWLPNRVPVRRMLRVFPISRRIRV